MRHLLLALLVLAFAASVQGATYTNTTTLSVTASDPDGDTLTYTWAKVSGPGTATFGSSNGTSTGNSCTATVSAVGTYSFQCTVSDGKGGTATSTVSNVVWTNRPTATAQSATTDEDVNKAITLAGADADGTIASYSIVTQPTKGTLSGTGASRTFIPTANANGSDSFTFITVDNNGVESTPATVTLTINPINDAPVNSVAPVISGTVRVGQTLTAANGTWSDPDGATTLVYAYKWQKADSNTGTNNADIASATASTYVLKAADRTKYIRILVTATDNGIGTPSTASSSKDSAYTVAVRNGPGDVNGDNAVTAGDVNAVKAAFGTTVGQAGYNANCDFDDNGAITVSDFNLVKSKFGTVYP